MLLDLNSLKDQYSLEISGVLHIGAHEAEELAMYESLHIPKVVWIEGNPKLYENLLKKLSPYKHHSAHNFLVSNENGFTEFRMTSFSQSSSLLELDKHKKYYKDIHEVEKIRLPVKTLKSLIDDHTIDIQNLNFINIDIQGAELMALQGLDSYLNNFSYIYSEFNTQSLYKECGLMSELDSFLYKHGFTRMAYELTKKGWGDAFYVKRKSLPKFLINYVMAKAYELKGYFI